MDDLAADADDSKDDDFEVLSGDGFGILLLLLINQTSF